MRQKDFMSFAFSIPDTILYYSTYHGPQIVTKCYLISHLSTILLLFACAKCIGCIGKSVSSTQQTSNTPHWTNNTYIVLHSTILSLLLIAMQSARACYFVIRVCVRKRAHVRKMCMWRAIAVSCCCCCCVPRAPKPRSRRRFVNYASARFVHVVVVVVVFASCAMRNFQTARELD